MKEKLLKYFQDHDGQYVSGEKISEQIGCSRTAVWKHIDELRKNGYVVESAPRRGYRLISKPDRVEPHEIKLALRTEKFAQEQTYIEEVTSTQEVAHELAYKGVEEGHLVVSNEQTKGKGRLGRKWHTKNGKAIAMSLILRPQLPPQKAPQLTLLTAVAIVRAIKSVTGINTDIKWPNDILMNGKKLVGILTEMQADPDRVHFVIIGIGMNVNETMEDFPDEVMKIATSIAIENGGEVNRAKLIAEIMYELEQLYALYLEKGFSAIRSIWEAHSSSIGTYLYARTIRETIYGYARGITDEGVLLLEDENGVTHQIYSADIELAHKKK